MGDPAPPILIAELKGETGLPGLRGLDGMDGLIGLPGNSCVILNLNENYI